MIKELFIASFSIILGFTLGVCITIFAFLFPKLKRALEAIRFIIKYYKKNKE